MLCYIFYTNIIRGKANLYVNNHRCHLCLHTGDLYAILLSRYTSLHV